MDEAPTSAYDRAAGAFRHGSYRGRVGSADLAAAKLGRLSRFAREKRWLYIATITEDVVAAAAIVRLGYASKAFWFAFNPKKEELLVEGSTLGRPGLAQVAPVGTAGAADLASFTGTGQFVRTAGALTARFTTRAFTLDVRGTTGPPEMTAVGAVPGGIVNVTEKGALMPADGTLTAAGRTFDLAGGFVGYDHTSGLLARHTAWKWAFAMGRDRDGLPFALNLVEGFIGAIECTVWTGGEIFPLAEPRITVGDRGRPWRIESDELSLSVTEGARHEENDSVLGIVRSLFAQGTGTFSGTVKTPKGVVHIDRVYGMVEDQDVLW